MKSTKYKIWNRWWYLLAVGIVMSTTGCERLLMEEDMEATPTATFEYLWRQIDERYSLFDVKEVDWQAMHDLLAPRIDDNMCDDSLFAVLSELLNVLDDGHVNLWSNVDVFSSEAIFLQRYGNGNFDQNTVILNYLRHNSHSTAGFVYNTVGDGKVLYIRYSSFMNSAPTKTLHYIMKKYGEVEGIVFDIRQNGGGSIQNKWNIMKLLPSEGQLLYSTQAKAGPAHDDFTEPTFVFAPDNDDDYPPYTKPFVVLTDRGCYSAASAFSLAVRTYDNVIVMGDTTAGGLAVPTGGALPNGWHYRFGVTRTLAPDGINYEAGVPPDQVVLLDPAASQVGRDNIIDSAITLITKNK